MAERSKDKKLFLYHSEPEKTKRQNDKKKRQKDIETKWHKYRKIYKRQERKKERKRYDKN